MEITRVLHGGIGDLLIFPFLPPFFSFFPISSLYGDLFNILNSEFFLIVVVFGL